MRLRRAQLIPTLFVLVGCYSIGATAPDDLQDFFGGLGPFSIPLMLVPDQLSMLKGDSAQMYITSSENISVATWSVSGRALLFAPPGGSLDTAVHVARSDVRVKAVRVGIDSVIASATIGGYRDTAEVQVVDSSAVTMISLYRDRGDTLKVGLTGGIEVMLKRDSTHLVRGLPTAVTISDSTVLSLQPPEDYYTGFPGRYFMRANKAGKVKVTFEFLSVRNSVDIVVLP